MTIAEHVPLDGAIEVGSTFKPKIVLSRPVDPATLTAANFYATATAGDKVPAKIVPCTDATFAWLFFDDPLSLRHTRFRFVLGLGLQLGQAVEGTLCSRHKKQAAPSA